jgi:hypothetical protein
MAFACDSGLIHSPILHTRQESLIQTEPTELFGFKHIRKLGSDGFETQHSIHMSKAILDDHTFAVQMVA